MELESFPYTIEEDGMLLYRPSEVLIPPSEMLSSTEMFPPSENYPTPDYNGSYQSSPIAGAVSPISSQSAKIYTPGSTLSFRETIRTSVTGSPGLPFNSIVDQHSVNVSQNSLDLAGVAGGVYYPYRRLSSSASQDGSTFSQNISLHQDAGQGANNYLDWLGTNPFDGLTDNIDMGTDFDMRTDFAMGIGPSNNPSVEIWGRHAVQDPDPWNAVEATASSFEFFHTYSRPSSLPGTQLSDCLFVDFEPDQGGHNPMPDQGPAFQPARQPPFQPPPARKNEKRRRLNHEASLIRGDKKRKVCRRAGQLDPRVAENARKRRHDHSCWRCFFHKKRCERESNDASCTLCSMAELKRTWKLGCTIQTLMGLVEMFVPEPLREQSKQAMIEDFIGRHAPRWTDLRYTVELDASFGPKIQVEATVLMHPTEPRSELVMDHRFVIDKNTRLKKCIQRESLPLAIKKIVVSEFKRKCNTYLDSVVENYLDRIPIRCFTRNTLQSDLLSVVCNYHKYYRGPQEHLLKKAIKMLVLTFVMTHALTMERSKVEHIARQLNQDPSQTYFASPKLLNKQIKGIMEEIHHGLMINVLQNLQKVIRDQKKSDWAAAFSVTLLVIMVVEDFQIAIGEFAHAEFEIHGRMPSGLGDISKLRKDIDEGVVDFLVELFHQGFKSAKFNPLQEAEGGADLKNHLDYEYAISLVSQIRELMKNYDSFMQGRQVDGDNSIEVFQKWNEGRLLTRFLLSFKKNSE